MLTNRFNHRVLPMLAPEEGGGGGGSSESTTEATKEQKDEFDGLELGDKGKEAIKREREARKAAEDARKAADDELATLRKEKADREAAEQKRKEKEAAEAGKFEELATTRERERDEAKTEVTRLTSEVDQLKAAMASGIATGWKDLPEEVRKLGEKQHAEEDVLGRFRFLNDPDTKALVAKLTGSTEGKAAHGRDPRATGTSKATNEDARKAQAAIYRNF